MLVSKRRGFKKLCQQEIFNVLVPILEKYRGNCSRDEFWGFITGTMSLIQEHIENKKQGG